MRDNDAVQYIHINSTLGRHYGACDIQTADEQVMVCDTGVGKALVICNRHDREKWEIEHKHACYVLGQQLGLQVNSVMESNLCTCNPYRAICLGLAKRKA